MKNLPLNKKYILIAVISILILLIFTIIIISTRPKSDSNQNSTANTTGYQDVSTGYNNDTPTPIPLKLPLSFHDLMPTKSTQASITDTIGKSKAITTQKEITIEKFPIGETSKYNTIFLKNNIVQYIIETKIDAQPIYTQFKNLTHKKEDGIMYDVYHNGQGYNLYVFSKEGIGFVSNPDTNQTIEIHYFAPTDYTDYFINSNPYLNQ